MNFLISRISTLFALAAVTFALTVAVQPAAAQFGSDGTTLNDFVLDADGYAWFKAKPYGASSLKPSPQLRFIADPGNARGGNALHPDSHKQVEDIIKDVIRDTGSYATFEIAWTDSQLRVNRTFSNCMATGSAPGALDEVMLDIL